jgi:hypothetical protein
MKRKALFVMIAVLLVSALMISCDHNVSDSSSDELAKVSLSFGSNTKSISGTVASNAPALNTLHWYYSAHKTDGGLYVTGETDWSRIGGEDPASPEGASLGDFSKGTWEFCFYGYSAVTESKPGTPSATAVYYAEHITKEILNDDFVAVSLVVGDDVDTEVVFYDLYIDTSEMVINPNAEGSFRLEISGLYPSANIESNTVNYDSDDVDGHFVFTYGEGETPPSSRTVNVDGSTITFGPKTLTFKVYFIRTYDSLPELVAEESYSVNITKGTTVTFSGNVLNADETHEIYIHLLSGSGTQADPYQISNATQLQAVISYTADNTTIDKYFILTDNIDLTGVAWTGIGTEEMKFQGNFDGKGYAIRNLSAGDSITGQDYGLFNVVEDATIKNLTIRNASVATKALNQGIVIGKAIGFVDIENITVESDCTITGYYATKGTESIEDDDINWTVGGIIGVLDMTGVNENLVIKNLTNKATVVNTMPFNTRWFAHSGGVIGEINMTGAASGNNPTYVFDTLINEGTLPATISGGLVGAIRGTSTPNRTFNTDDFEYMTLQFKDCINRSTSATGEFIGWVDEKAHYIEFLRCRTSRYLTPVATWNSSLIDSVTAFGPGGEYSYSVNKYIINNGTTSRPYLIATENETSGYIIKKYSSITDDGALPNTILDLFMADHTEGNYYNNLNKAFENNKNAVNVSAYEVSGLFVEVTGTPNYKHFKTDTVIELVEPETP